MKHTKKFVSFLLTLVMALALAATAFAAGETGSITVDNPKENVNYTAYKVFDVTYNEEQTAYSYTLARTSDWFDVVASVEAATGKVTSKIAGLTFTKAAGGDVYVVTMATDGSFSAAAMAKKLKENLTEKTGYKLNVADGKATADNLPLGYYLVVGSKDGTTEALANLTTTNPDVTIHDKNDIPFDKEDDKDSVEVGETVHYTLTGKVPDTTEFRNYIYKVTDTMSKGLTFNKDVVVKIGNDDITKATGTEITYTDDGFEVIIPVKQYEARIGETITLTYSAVVNENAVAQIEKNHATLEFSNDPTDYTNTDHREDVETVYSAKVVIEKYDANDKNKKLAGAEFILYKEVENKDNTTSKLYYKYHPATETEKEYVEWVTDQNEATVKTTDKNGAVSFDGLKDGTYYLLETKAPAGYNLLDTPYEVIIDGHTATLDKPASLTVLTTTAKIANNTGILLPSTGGMGTTIFYVLGSILLVGAAVLLIAKKRMSNDK